MKYRKKPVVIEAVQWLGDESVLSNFPEALFESYEGETAIYIHTLEGEMRCDLGDWIIQGVQGECYPCKPDIFEQTYEPVGDER